jgi:two-component system sensor histidine kinase PilS (NtrC family)
MEQQLLLKRLRWFLVSRLSVAITGLVAIWIYQKGQWLFPPHILAIYLILVFACLVNIVYFLLIQWACRLESLRTMALVKVAVDILLISALCYFSGGISSIFAYLFFAAIVAAALLVSGKAGIGLASLTTVLLAGITLTYTLGAQLHFDMPLIPEKYLLATAQEIRFIIPYLFFFGLSLHLVAWLAGRLAIELTREQILKADILQNMLHGLIVVDRQGIIAFWNPKATEMLSLPPGLKLIGTRIDEILSDSKYKDFRRALLNNLRINQTLEYRDNRGEMIYLEINTSVLEDKQKRLRGMIAILTDITLKKQMEEIIKQSERLQSLQEMSFSLAHEVRNPLSSIKGAVQALGTYWGNTLKDDEHKLMNLIIKESDRLNKIVTDFLEFASKKPLVRQRANLTELIDEVVMLLKRSGKNINLVLELMPALMCECDAASLKQVFLNLGLNALEASPTGSVVTFKAYQAYREAPLEAIINRDREVVHNIPSRVRQGNNSKGSGLGITIEVIDQGSGVKQEHLNRIFEPFFTTKAKGVGLGLSVAHKIIREHYGLIWCESLTGEHNTNPVRESQPGMHTRFIVWLPVSPPEENPLSVKSDNNRDFLPSLTG